MLLFDLSDEDGSVGKRLYGCILTCRMIKILCMSL